MRSGSGSRAVRSANPVAGYPPAAQVCLLEGCAAIWQHSPLLQAFAARCGQAGAMGWTSYFFGGRGSQWKRPIVVTLLRRHTDLARAQVDDLLGAALFFELRPLGLPTHIYATDDWQGLRTVVAPEEWRATVACAAAEALLSRRAQIVLATFAAGPSEPLEDLRTRSGIRWAAGQRELRTRLRMEPTYDALLARFGKKTRTSLRYHRKRLEANVELEFVRDAGRSLSLHAMLQLGASALNPISPDECRRRFAAAHDPGGFIMGLRRRDVADQTRSWLSVVTGWRQADTTIVHSQMNARGYEKESVGTVMRSFLLESEIERRTRELVFYHGTAHSMSHAFESDRVIDLLVEREGLPTSALHSLARLLVKPTRYRAAHYPGGSATFFAAALASDAFEWRTGGGSNTSWPTSLPGVDLLE